MMKNRLIRGCYVPARYVVAILGFWGFFNVYAMRVNLSVAIVAMVNSTASPPRNITTLNDTECAALGQHWADKPAFDDTNQGEFDWDIHTQSLILGSFFYGYTSTHFLGGIAAENLSAKWVFGLGCLITGALTMATPVAARAGVPVLVALRVIIGAAEGVMLPSCNVLISRWAAKMERNRFLTIVFTGVAIGSVVALTCSGILIDSGVFGGWPSTFYVFGFIGCVWFVFWAFLVYEYPSQNPWISQSELKHIQEFQECHDRKGISIPWKSLCTSIPVWSLIVASFGHLYGYHMIVTETPTYLADVMHFDIRTNGFLCSLPHILHSSFGIAAGCVADHLRKSGKFRITTIRKICNSIAYFGSGACLLLIAFSGCRPILIVGLLCAAMAFSGFIYAGISVTHIDMSPDYAGTLVGITNTVGSASGFLAPYVVGRFVGGGQTFHNWGLVFITSAVLYFICGIVYDVGCSAELQPWGSATTKRTSVDEQPSPKSDRITD